jgi:hypothetical protein
LPMHRVQALTSPHTRIPVEPQRRQRTHAHRSTAPHGRSTHSRERRSRVMCAAGPRSSRTQTDRYAYRRPRTDVHAQTDMRRDVLRICTNYRESPLHCRRRGSPCTIKVVVRFTTVEVLTGTSTTGGDLHAGDDVSSLVEVRVHGRVGHSRAHAVPTRSATVPHGIPCCAGYRAAWDTVPHGITCRMGYCAAHSRRMPRVHPSDACRTHVARTSCRAIRHAVACCTRVGTLHVLHASVSRGTVHAELARHLLFSMT